MADIYVQFLSLLFTSCLTYSGDYSIRVPPLPSPNREVKPDHADGTASSGRVGSCRFSGKPPYRKIWGLFVFIPPTVLFNSPPPGGRVPAGRGGR